MITIRTVLEYKKKSLINKVIFQMKTQIYTIRTQQQVTRNLLDDREERFEKLDEDLIAILQFEAYVVRLDPRQVLEKHIFADFCTVP